MIDEVKLLAKIGEMQRGLKPPALVPFVEIHRAVHEETMQALKRLYEGGKITLHRQLNDWSAQIK